MTSPDFRTCSEEELWHFVAGHLEGDPAAYDELVQRLAESETPDRASS